MARETSRPQLRPRVVDLNLLPDEYQRRAVSMLSLLFFLAVAVAVASVLAVNQAKAEQDLALTQMKAAVQKNRKTIAQLQTLEPQAKELRSAVDEAKKQLETMQKDYQIFVAGRVKWSGVLETLLRLAPPGLSLSSIAQTGGNKITLKGGAPHYLSTIEYSVALQKSGLFSSVNLEQLNKATPTATPTGTAPPTPTPRVILPPAPTTTPTPFRTPGPSPSPTSTPRPPGTPTTPTPTTIPSPTPTPVPQLYYAVISKQRQSFPDTVDRYSVIRGQVLDENGNLIPNLRFRVSSCCPPWEAYYPSQGIPPSDGNFQFLVGKWTFDLVITDTISSEVAKDLNTLEPGFTGYHVWTVIFQRTRSGSQATPTPPAPQAQAAPQSVSVPSPTSPPPGKVQLVLPQPLPTPSGSVSFVIILEVAAGPPP
ncbi:MAG: hypothetical protein HYU86_05725 [Chloroflexi bacterium]|nr:hypothetical protein [Chloroflexota bacterium]